MFEELKKTPTEEISRKNMNLNDLSIMEILRIINDEDKKVAEAVEKVLEEIGKAVEIIIEAIKNGGKIFYVGAGTSGRLAVIDAAELLPTFNVGPEIVEAIIAGGPGAMFRAMEGAEDNEEEAIRELKAKRIKNTDVVIGITASGRTPFIISALKYAKGLGARTIAITSNRMGEVTRYSDITIAPETGPEVITGSTRMKAATAQKMILTMISTTVMIKLGKVRGSLMINLTPLSGKLRERAKRIIMEEAGVSYETAEERLMEADGNVTLAIIMAKTGLSKIEAEKVLEEAGNIPSKAIEMVEVKKKWEG
ncbi:MAG: N-acetylmuramic acid 6-phosphate etherase [Candidatus Methanomethylicia archaeon]